MGEWANGRMAVEFTPEAMTKFKSLVGQYEETRAALLPVLHLAQRAFAQITPEVEEYIADLMQLPPVKVHEVFTFYTLYRKKPSGKHVIRLCKTLSCHLLGAESIREHLCKKIGLHNGSDTTEDGRFTLELVECMGACELAPMMQIDERYYGPLTPEKVDAIIDGLTDEPAADEVN
ncbi:MAG: NAD(P)H-dependent oxidoreductase subunit E [Armatimonadetes bacterium CG07_land_8_20_14_0_80_59_28]|nr:MAG: NAD(P)H-dependent oxidoreductase subunit E [Armatimonadetes bacterium CG07_land_8_20_14_0_80_59_28]PIY42992.1 MAG: NAD(P)H-dependent oxidoreductase subunit E [Armatimonadetes bacterium CG_4_10_14_3_um_filter_59_10]